MHVPEPAKSLGTVIHRSTVSDTSNGLFVTFPPSSEARRRTAEAAVLLGLTSPLAGPPASCPLVALSLSGSSCISRPSNTKPSGKRVLKLDLGNDLRSLKEAFLPGRNHLPQPLLFRQQSLTLDEGYLHHLLASWKGKTALDRAMIIGSAMTQGNTLTFTVDFSEQRQKTLGKNLSQALRKLRNQLSAISSMGPALAVLEHTKNGRLHLHGMVITDESASALKDALWALGGVPDNPHFRNLKQVHIQPASNAVCWAMYMTKEMLRMRPGDAGELIYASHSASRLGKEHLGELVSLARQKLGITPDLRGRAAVYSQSVARRSPKTGTRH